jgi:pectate lyase
MTHRWIVGYEQHLENLRQNAQPIRHKYEPLTGLPVNNSASNFAGAAYAWLLLVCLWGSRAAPAPLDDFNRANQGPPPSSNWTSGLIPGQLGLKVLDNTLVVDTTSTSSIWWNASTFPADAEVSVLFADATTSAFRHLRLFLRVTQPGVAGQTTGYFCQAEPDPGGVTGGVYLRRIDSGAATAPLAQRLDIPWATGDQAKCSMVGSQLCVSRMASGSGVWTELLCLTDTTYATGGVVGVGMNHPELAVDDFSAGAVVMTTPTVTITAPTSAPTFSTTSTPLTTLAGTASDDVGVSSVTVSCSPSCGSPTVVGTTSWSVANLPLQLGTNVITVTATDGDSQTGQDVLTVTYTTGPQLAFPTAEGYGRFAQGGRGGKAYNINDLGNSWGSGGSCNAGGCSGGTITLRDCLGDRFGVGARTCIFKVGGLITWNCQADVGNPGCLVTQPYITIAGQTAPGDGILLKNFELQFRDTYNVIVRHLRIRPGKDIVLPLTGGALEVYEASQPCYKMIFDHVSLGWAPDDTFVIWGGHDITLQWSLMSDGIGGPDSGPSKCGQLNPFASGSKSLSILHNFWSNHNDRCPAIGMGNQQLVNNLFYNFYQGTHVNPAGPTGQVPYTEFVNNYFRPGPNNPNVGTSIVLYGCGTGADCTNAANSLTYLSGNIHTYYRPTLAGSETAMVFQAGSPDMPISATPLGFVAIPSQTDAFTARDQALARAGAYAVGDGIYNPVRRDSIDQKAINDFNNGTGGNSLLDEALLGGYPTYSAGVGYTDTDWDGIADAWETAHGLNPTNAADGPQLAANGYSNLENFLNELAGDEVSGSRRPPAPRNPRVRGVR